MFGEEHPHLPARMPRCTLDEILQRAVKGGKQMDNSHAV